MLVLKAERLTKVYGGGKSSVLHKALNNFSLEVEKGEFIGVMGPSGSGKTTLLNILATLDEPTSGEIEINGTNIKAIKRHQLAIFRRRELGFIFQDYNLLDTLTVKENIILPLVLDGIKQNEMERRVEDIARFLGIEGILDKRPYEVSGGQQQRAAVARAIIHQPSVILADEPTGNLDSKSSKQVMEALQALNAERRATIMMVTHDPFAASYCQRIVFIKDGEMFAELHRGSSRQVFFQQIMDTSSALGSESS
ncbi:ABC transporter related protein [Caldalkalibacillus thermarum TA2.A1]|uniref:ABC transporter ATP-binding protein n=1 Tax=Caldalkalibacillus thermarum (strain TA2.A1) TaxID=986075 RepID=F5L7W3_CALTT|nr:ABC transporter ATP-binding protein [Caldalkalibacillus thermarum]EGL82551.1 ABC transporter related protein [Caldalkalibacillus thermarum TA2.A1]QZT34796.1 ABC transporter ATP-binding protein [Caldalkalibacillus thermarum TA2.A1]